MAPSGRFSLGRALAVLFPFFATATSSQQPFKEISSTMTLNSNESALAAPSSAPSFAIIIGVEILLGATTNIGVLAVFYYNKKVRASRVTSGRRI